MSSTVSFMPMASNEPHAPKFYFCEDHLTRQKAYTWPRCRNKPDTKRRCKKNRRPRQRPHNRFVVEVIAGTKSKGRLAARYVRLPRRYVEVVNHQSRRRVLSLEDTMLVTEVDHSFVLSA